MTLGTEDTELIFRNARSQNGSRASPFSDEQICELDELI